MRALFSILYCGRYAVGGVPGTSVVLARGRCGVEGALCFGEPCIVGYGDPIPCEGITRFEDALRPP